MLRYKQFLDSIIDPETGDSIVEGTPQWEEFQQWLVIGNVVEPADTETPIVPQVVTRFQARAALLMTPSGNGFSSLLAEVDALMMHPDTNQIAQLAWTDAQEFYRKSPTILDMSVVLEFSNEKLDDLFTLAATIQA